MDANLKNPHLPTLEEMAAKEREYIRDAFSEGAAGLSSAFGGQQSTLNQCEEPCREPLQHRFRNQLQRAVRESRKADQLQELVFLLDKNPEIARILDLIDAVR